MAFIAMTECSIKIKSIHLLYRSINQNEKLCTIVCCSQKCFNWFFIINFIFYFILVPNPLFLMNPTVIISNGFAAQWPRTQCSCNGWRCNALYEANYSPFNFNRKIGKSSLTQQKMELKKMKEKGWGWSNENQSTKSAEELNWWYQKRASVLFKMT